MTDSYASIAAKPKTATGSFSAFASEAKNFTWPFFVDYHTPTSISVIAFTVDEARQQILDTLTKIVPFAAEKNTLGDDAYKHLRDLRQKIPASVQLGCYCRDIFDYTEDLIVWDYKQDEIKLGDFIRNTLPEIRPFHFVTFYSCLDG